MKYVTCLMLIYQGCCEENIDFFSQQRTKIQEKLDKLEQLILASILTKRKEKLQLKLTLIFLNIYLLLQKLLTEIFPESKKRSKF